MPALVPYVKVSHISPHKYLGSPGVPAARLGEGRTHMAVRCEVLPRTEPGLWCEDAGTVSRYAHAGCSQRNPGATTMLRLAKPHYSEFVSQKNKINIF